ncbi:MAG: hypothetical protein JO091_05940 [Acidobacteriaceae bacterium]|nr:hypothetical protein [Acidobacteriaceae bacterium]
MVKLILLSLVGAAALMSADTLVLRNGTTLEGSFVGANSHSVRFAVGDRVNSYSIDDIESVRFSNAAPIESSRATPRRSEDANYPQAPAPPPPPSSAQASYPPAPSAPVQAPNPPLPPAVGERPPAPRENYPSAAARQSSAAAPIEVPAGTQIVVRLIDAADSQHDRLGQTYRASVDDPVVVNGQTVIPRGADATATLTDLQQSGKIEGRTVLTLDLKTVTLNGRTYDIVTTGVPEASKSRGARSAKTIGGGAVLGAIIGAAVGGGKGAAIGAGSGAAVGTAAEIATSGQKVKIPSETRLTFTLQNALTI